jgi:hypothetical protein
MTHAIITFSGVHYLITAEQELALRSKGNNEDIIINGNTLRVKNISDILTLEKYYETYPDRKPDILPEYKQLPEWTINRYMQRKSCLQKMINGFKQYIAEKDGKVSQGCLSQLKHMENKLANAN